jgi:hypothetical protein
VSDTAQDIKIGKQTDPGCTWMIKIRLRTWRMQKVNFSVRKSTGNWEGEEMNDNKLSQNWQI